MAFRLLRVLLLASAWDLFCLPFRMYTDTQLYLGLLLNLFIIIGTKRIRNCLLSSVVGSACLSYDISPVFADSVSQLVSPFVTQLAPRSIRLLSHLWLR